MSRDTRLDEPTALGQLLNTFGKLQYRRGEEAAAGTSSAFRGELYEQSVAARRAIEELHAEVVEERETYRRAWNRADEELENLRAASLSVSPVPPNCANCGYPLRDYHHTDGGCFLGCSGEDATTYEPEAVSPVPEPSEPQK